MNFKKVLHTAVLLTLFIGVSLGTGVLIYNERLYSTRTIEAEVDFNGVSVDVVCKGIGSPTVLFEPGLNEHHSTFYNIQVEISKQTRTFSYDRMSIAYSENGKSPRSSLAEVKNLHKLLEQQKVKPPYIIVAHSIAGYNARLFAAEYQKEVAGIVFIDCSHEDQSFRSLSNDPSYTELSADELFVSQQQLRESRDKDALRNIPITVLTAGYYGRSEYEFMKGYWYPLQNDLASLSDRSNHIVIKDSGHMLQSEYPEIVIREIKKLLKR